MTCIEVTTDANVATVETAYSTWTLCESLPVSGICSLESTHGPCHFSMSVLVRRGPVMPSPRERYPVNVRTKLTGHFQAFILFTDSMLYSNKEQMDGIFM